MNTKRDKIQTLERLALAGHQHGQSWRAYFAANVGTITSIIRSDPAGWGSLRDRLLALLVSGETSGQYPAGDGGDSPEPIPVVQAPSDTGTAARLQKLPGVPLASWRGVPRVQKVLPPPRPGCPRLRPIPKRSVFAFPKLFSSPPASPATHPRGGCTPSQGE